MRLHFLFSVLKRKHDPSIKTPARLLETSSIHDIISYPCLKPCICIFFFLGREKKHRPKGLWDSCGRAAISPRILWSPYLTLKIHAVFAFYPIIYPCAKIDALGRCVFRTPKPYISSAPRLLLLRNVPSSLRNITDLVSFANFILRKRWASFLSASQPKLVA